jgi:hypothetical protein
MPWGEGVGLAPDEIHAHAALVQAQAAQTQAFAAAAALAQKAGSATDAKLTSNPSADHTSFTLRRAVIFAVGAHSSYIAPRESLSASFQETLQDKFRSGYRTQTTWGLEHIVTVNMVVCLSRGDPGRLNIDEFTKKPVEALHAAEPVMNTPLKFEPAPQAVMDTDEFHSCVERAAVFLSLIYYEGAGASLKAYNAATYAIITEDPALSVSDYRAIIAEGLRRVSHATRVELERVSAKAQELGKAPLGAGSQGLQTMRDVHQRGI